MNPAESFLELSPARRALVFEQAAAQRGLSPVILEKDFWVCWLLGILFADPSLAPHLVFKGGTSLSKVFKVIDRFSEDIDICVAPEFVGADPLAFDQLTSRTQRDEAISEMQRLCAVKVQEQIQPRLEKAILEALDSAGSRGDWLSFESDRNSGSANLYFNYPAAHRGGFAYLRRTVKLELGTLTDQQPTGNYSIQPWVADVFPAMFPDWSTTVIALELGRSFWEKATILHAEFHRPELQPLPERYARHYSDFGRLLEHPDAPAILADTELCNRVVSWKSKAFARAWASYGTARHGTFKLAPPGHRRSELAKDYAEMGPMFLVKPVPFEQLLQQLLDAEATINSG